MCVFIYFTPTMPINCVSANLANQPRIFDTNKIASFPLADSLNDLCPKNILSRSFGFVSGNYHQVELESFDRSGAYVPLAWNASSLKKYEVCDFKVEANKFEPNRGVFATVQKMSLRKSITGECIDFVTFKHENGISSARLCGNYKATDDYTGDHTKFFADDVGSINVHIELDVNRPLVAPHETLELELYLTAFTKGTFECDFVFRLIKQKSCQNLYVYLNLTFFMARLHSSNPRTNILLTWTLHFQKVRRRRHNQLFTATVFRRGKMR